MKKPHIQIHDSKKRNGEYFIRYVAANGKKLAHSETLTTIANVQKNIKAMAQCFYSTECMVEDCTKVKLYLKIYGCKSGLKKLSRSTK